MDAKTRAAIQERAISVWLRADLDLLHKRTSRRNNRPLLKRGDPRAILEGLMAERYPVYGEADIVVDSVDGPPEITVERVRAAIESYVEIYPAGQPGVTPEAQPPKARPAEDAGR